MNEFFRQVSVSDFLKEETHEDICVVHIENNEWRILRMLEFWDNAPAFAESEPFRILCYYGNQWILDKEFIKREGLIPAVVQRQGEVCGGIYFEGEDKRDTKIKETLLQMVRVDSHGEYQIVEVVNNDLFQLNISTISDGFYIFDLKGCKN